MPQLQEQLETALGPAYRVERELGGGGMSRVFVAQDLSLGRRVAIKVLPPELAGGITAERFRREIQLAAQLQHPHIVPRLTSERAAGLVFYLMPYVEGETLRARLAREGVLPPEAAVRIARDVAEALGYAHAKGVVHRDIKPENILLSSGHALVLDFGVAKAVRESTVHGGGTTAGVALGTPLYMAPEQAAGGGDVDGRADLYALGVVLYEMLAGQPPFESESAYDLLAAHIADQPEPLRRRSAETPAALEAVVMRCLAKRTRERYQTAGELVTHLDGLATPAGGVRAISRTHTRRLLVAGVAVAAVVSAVVGVRAAGMLGPRTLVAEGAIQEREPVILTDFENHTADSMLGTALTEAFRIDLSQSPVVSVVAPARVTVALTRMRRDPAATLERELGREVARREGIRAVVAGNITRVGDSYVVFARIENAETGEVLAGFREVAANANEIIRALDRVSKQLRRRIGESVRSVAEGPPLEHVTTASLQALSLYSQGVRVGNAGHDDRATTLFEAAIRIDSTFASAYRGLAIAYGNWGANPGRRMEAFVRTFELRDRLPERERLLAEAGYYAEVEYRPDRAIAAYEAVLRLNSADQTALNNLAVLQTRWGNPAVGLMLYRGNVATDSSAIARGNLIEAEFDQGSERAADSALAAWSRAVPGEPGVLVYGAMMAGARQRYDSADMLARKVAAGHGDALAWTAETHTHLAGLARLRGRLAEAHDHDARAIATRTSTDTTGALRTAQLAIYQALTLALLKGPDASAPAALHAAVRRAGLDRVAPIERPYLRLADALAYGGRGDLAQGVLQERTRALEAAGPGGRAMLHADSHVLQARRARANTLRALGRTDAAITELRGHKNRGTMFWLLPELGAAYHAAGQTDSAVAVYERYLRTRWLRRVEADGWHRPRILYRLGELYEASGDRARAADYYSQFAELWRRADPDLQPRVAEARRRLAALTAEPERP
ncbi:MAG: protein kinase domain-containing protein [Gemmatimonadales bacterium]